MTDRFGLLESDSNKVQNALAKTGKNGVANRAKLFVWAWGIVQVLGGLALSYFADKLVTDATAVSILKPLLIFFGASLGVTYIAMEFQIDGVLQRELSSIKDDIAEQRRELDSNVKKVIGESVRNELADLKSLLPVFDAYLSIGAEDSFGSRDRILGAARTQLEHLARGRYEIEGDDYYDWLKDRLTKKRPESVRAISFRPLSVYSNDPREKNFIKNNSDAIGLGTIVSRIFVLDKEELFDVAARRVLKSHFSDSGALCFVAWKSELSAPLRGKLEGGGLSIYDTDHIFYDRSYFAVKLGHEGGEASAVIQEVVPRAVVYGRNDPEFRNLERLFENLLTNFVDPALRNLRGAEAYKWCCQNVASWAAANSRTDTGIIELGDELKGL